MSSVALTTGSEGMSGLELELELDFSVVEGTVAIFTSRISGVWVRLLAAASNVLAIRVEQSSVI